MYRASIYSVTPFVIVSTTVAGFGFGLKFSQANRSTALYPSLAPSHTLSLSHSRLCTWFPLPCLCTLPLSANPPCLGQMLNLFRRIFITRDTAKAKAMYKRVPADIKICTGVSHAADAAEAVAEAHAQMQGKMGEASEVATIEKLQKDLRAMLGDAKGADKQKAVRVAQQVRPLVRFLLGVGVPDEDEAPASE